MECKININTIFHFPGNKGKLVNQIFSVLPEDCSKYNYVDLFFGGGNAYLNLPRTFKSYYLSDKLNLIINFFNQRFTDKQIIDFFIYVEKEFDVANNKEGYYRFREHWNQNYNKNKELKYIGFLILVNSCINNMIRFGPNGLNQSYGNRNIKINVLLSGMHSIRPNSTFIVSDFRDVKLESDDLVYADPPYIDCFDMYKWKWDKEDQQKLLEKLYKHHLNGGKYILSGLSVVNGEDNTKNITIPDSRIIPIKKSYKITSTKGKTRKNHQEIIVTNL